MMRSPHDQNLVLAPISRGVAARVRVGEISNQELAGVALSDRPLRGGPIGE